MLFCTYFIFFYKQEKFRECYKSSSKFHFMVYFLQLIKLHVPTLHMGTRAVFWLVIVVMFTGVHNTNNDNRRMSLEAAHIDKDAQDLSRALDVDALSARVPRAHCDCAAISHSYIQNYNECFSSPARPAPIRERGVAARVCMLIRYIVQCHSIVAL